MREHLCTSFFFRYAPTPAHKRRDAAYAKMDELFSAVIKARHDSGKRCDETLDTFMNSEYKDTPGVSILDQNVVGLLIALLFAGQHTNSLTLTWAVTCCNQLRNRF
ncbi:hypothetical protein LEN26_020616 [Aphanomyces euteiches]|nr:hypothetical protein LEN26_020616 [Aphanomyces euteiches]KAH9111698.1 hypothetical protein AeMF1_013855 [Aphanomyces euteiches]